MVDFAKYHLNTLDQLFDFCRELKYGWVDQAGKRHLGPNDQPGFRLQSPSAVLESRLAICWEQTELQRAWFMQHHIACQTYLLYYYLSDDNCPSHSILVYREGEQYCWFEPMFQDTPIIYYGIHRYATLDALLADFRQCFTHNNQLLHILPSSPHPQNFRLYRYTQPEFSIDDTEFYQHCRQGESITIPFSNEQGKH